MYHVLSCNLIKPHTIKAHPINSLLYYVLNFYMFWFVDHHQRIYVGVQHWKILKVFALTYENNSHQYEYDGCH